MSKVLKITTKEVQDPKKEFHVRAKFAKRNVPSFENKKILALLDAILELELSGISRYLHYSLMITGPNRIPIVKWFRDQANEALSHAAIIGEKITSLGGHPSLRVQPVPETNQHSVISILEESLQFEVEALQMYQKLLKLCGKDIGLEEMARQLCKEEQEHIEEVLKMLNR